LVIIGVTDEKESLVDAWVKKHKPTFPIAILADDSFEKAIGVKGFPTVAVIEPGSKLAYAGYLGKEKEPLKQAIAASDQKPLFPERLDETRRLLQEGTLTEAYVAAIKANGFEDHDESQAVWTRAFRKYVEDKAAELLTKANKAVEDGVIYRAVDLATPIAESKVAFPATPKAKELLASLSALETYKDELKGGAAFEKAAEKEREGDYFDAAKAYLKISKKRSWADTKIAQAALARAKKLAEEGRLGYRASCNNCRSAKRACAKHEKTLRF